MPPTSIEKEVHPKCPYIQNNLKSMTYESYKTQNARAQPLQCASMNLQNEELLMKPILNPSYKK
jgi:hypothetical protein